MARKFSSLAELLEVIGDEYIPIFKDQFKTKRLQLFNSASSILKVYADDNISNMVTIAKSTLRSSTVGFRLGRFNESYVGGKASELIMHNTLLPNYLSDVIRNSQHSYYNIV